jgi:hypothetical protein
MSKHRRLLRWALTSVALGAAAAVTPSAAPAASTREPTGEFARFAQCPRFTPGVNLCVYVKMLSGTMSIGRRTVPVERPITLQGGIAQDEEPPFTERFFGAVDGETLSRTPIPVPGGLAGTPLEVTLELAGPPSAIVISKRSLLGEEGVGLSLPVRLRLENTFLGSECYIGSASHPVVMGLTTGRTSPNAPNMPISGEIGLLRQKDEFALAEVVGVRLVNDSFALPEASGCGGHDSSFVHQLVDYELGLPSPDGHNTIIENQTLWEATTTGVIRSEGT